MINRFQEHWDRFKSAYIFVAIVATISILTSNLIAGLAAVMPLVAVYTVYKHYQWYQALKPSTLLFFLLVSTITVGVSTTGLAAISLFRQLILGTNVITPQWLSVISTICVLAIILQAYARTLTLHRLDIAVDELKQSKEELFSDPEDQGE